MKSDMTDPVTGQMLPSSVRLPHLPRHSSCGPKLSGQALRVEVVGGGPAGDAATEALVKGGVETVLIERKLDNWKPCGGAIQLCMVGEFDIPLDIIDRRVTKMKMVISPSNVADWQSTSGAARSSPTSTLAWFATRGEGMESSCLVNICFKGDIVSCRVTHESTVDLLKNKVCDRWTSLDPLSFRFRFLHSDGTELYVESDFWLRSLVGGFNSTHDVSFDLYVEQIYPPCSSSTSFPCQSVHMGPSSSSSSSLSRCSPTVKDKRVVRFYEGSTETVKKRKSDMWPGSITGVGQIFLNGVEEVRNAVRKVCFESRHPFHILKSEPARYTVCCKNYKTHACLWSFHAISISKDNQIFEVKRYVEEHNCGAGYMDKGNLVVPAKFVKSLVSDIVRMHPKKSAKFVVDDFKVDYGLSVTYGQTYHGIRLVHEEMYGDDVRSYSDLCWYVNKVKETNNGSVIDFQKDDSSMRFDRLFLSYGACVEGFQYCRPMLYLDATFLTGRFRGCLMSATAKNGNQQFYPLAYGIVSAEDGDNWEWFLRNLKNVVGCSRRIVFLSDQGTGLVSEVPKVFPNDYHSFCYYHMKNNIPLKEKGNERVYQHVIEAWRQAVYALTPGGYRQAIKKIYDVNCGHVVNWMNKQKPEHWSNAFFPGCRYGEVASSCAESFNAWIKAEKKMPISALVNVIRVKMMKMISDRHKDAIGLNSKLTPYAEDMLKKLTDDGMCYRVYRSGDFEFEVNTDTSSHMVNLLDCHCSCRRWKVYGFPCSHAIQCIRVGSDKSIYDFVEQYWTSDYYRKLYSCAIRPLPDSEKQFENNSNDVVLPPVPKRGPGRPKADRYKSKYENKGKEKRKMRCQNCFELGNHNRTTCPLPPRAATVVEGEAPTC